MGHMKSRNKFYDNIAKVIEEKTIKEKEITEVEVIKEEGHYEFYAPSIDSYIIESDDDLNLFNITPNSEFKVGDLIYVIKIDKPLLKFIVLITEINVGSEITFEVIDSFDPPLEIEGIDEIIRGKVL